MDQDEDDIDEDDIDEDDLDFDDDDDFEDENDTYYPDGIPLLNTEMPQYQGYYEDDMYYGDEANDEELNNEYEANS